MLCTSLPKSGADWGYRTVMQPNADNRRLDFTQGKIIGGTSSINWMTYSRGNAADYDEWEAMGCKGWSYQVVDCPLIVV